MKKLVSALLAVVITVAITAMPAMAKDNITVELDGKEIVFDVQPQLINDRTMVPLRAIFESLGATVAWDQSTKTVVSTKDGTVIVLTIDNPIMKVNGEEIRLDTSACIINERTLVPVRAISEAFKLKVDWNGATKTVVIENGSTVVVEPTPIPTSTPTPSPTPKPTYDDATTPINNIKSYISKGLYLEAMELCDSTVENYDLSPADKVIISDLYDTAKEKYDDYLESSKPVYTYSAFNSLKNSIISKGKYDKYGKYSISYYYNDSLTSLKYDPAKDDVTISVLITSDSGDSFISLTIEENENPNGGVILTVGSNELIMLFEYVNGKRVTLRNDFNISSSLNSKANNMVDSTLKLFDLMLERYTDVTLSDFGVYY